MRALITGAGGFVGGHLRRALEQAGHEVQGMGNVVSGADLCVDITDARQTGDAVAQVQPDAVIHLAGLSSVSACEKDPQRAFQVNAGGTLNVARAVLELKSKCRLLVVSSGEVYGAVASAEPIREEAVPDPMNTYAATKRAAEIMALQLRHVGLDVVIARPFNHIGAGQTATFVLPSFAQQLVSAPPGARVNLSVGNLSAVRDFSHVDDVIAGYLTLLERGVPGAIYNLGSGVGRSIESMLQLLIAASGREATVTVDPARLRPVDIPVLCGDASRVRALGWAPTHSILEAIAEVLASASVSG